MNMPDDSLDELASAYLDNELSASERADAEANPQVMRRAELFEATRRLVAQPVDEPSPERRERAIAAAMASMEAQVIPLKGRDRRIRWQLGAGVGAAAVVIGLLVAIVASSNSSDDSSSSNAATAIVTVSEPATGSAAPSGSSKSTQAASQAPSPEAATATAGSDAGGAADSRDSGAATASTAAPTAATPQPFGSSTPPNIGQYSDATSLGQATQTLTASAASPQACEGQVLAELTWDGQPAQLVERTDNTRVVVAPDCFVLAFVDRPVPTTAP